jgi:hypothetical protein
MGGNRMRMICPMLLWRRDIVEKPDVIRVLV